MLPSGKYYIGNIASVLTDNDWFHIQGDGEFSLSGGRKIAIYTIPFLDYCFWDLQGRCYVMKNEQLIGCIKVDDIRKPNADLSKGHVIEFDEEFETGMNGLDIYFGRVVIQTESEEEENYEDEEDYYENDEEDEEYEEY